MAEQTDNTDMSDEPDRQDLEDRVDQLESTISKMLPGRRDALKLGGAALVGGAAMSGTASAGTQQAGTIGTANDPVDVESEDINNADTVTTKDLVVNGTATGPFGGGDFTRVRIGSNQSISANTTTKINYDGVVVDELGYDATNAQLSVPSDGTYSVIFSLRPIGGGTNGDNIQRQVRVNGGTEYVTSEKRQGDFSALSPVSVMLKLQAGDTIELFVKNRNNPDELTSSSSRDFATFTRIG